MAYVTTGSLRGNALEIGVALVLQDRFSNQAREASAAIRRLHNEAKLAVTANLETASGLLSNLNNSFVDIAAGISSTVVQGAEFIDTMTTVSAITNSTDEQLKMLSKTAQSLGLETMFGSQDIASGMKYLAMAGNKVEDINDMIKGAAYVANATGMELGGKGGAADLITNVMKTFKIEGQGAAEMVGDQLTKATLASNISMTDLAESIKYAAADMVILKKELPEVAAMIGTLGNAGIQGSMAGTSLGNMARYLIQAFNPGTNAYSYLQKMGLSKSDFVDANGDLLDIADILEKIKNAMAGLSSTEQGHIMKYIFGVRGQRAANVIMNDLEGYRNLLNEIQNNSAGFAKSIVEKRMNTLAGSIDKMSSAWENLKVTFVESVAPLLIPIFNTVASIVESLREVISTPFGAFLSGLFTVSTFVGLVGSKVLLLITRWRLLRSDTQIGFSNMIRLIIGGWNSASLSLAKYIELQKLMNAHQTHAGLPWYAALAKEGGMPVGGVMYDKRTKRWVSHDEKLTGLGKGTFMKESEAVKYTEKYGTGEQVVGGFFASTTSGATKGTWWTKALGIGSKLFGALSWVSLGLMVIVPVIKALTSAINGNTEQVEKNTFSIHTLAGKYTTEAERISAGKNLDLAQEYRLFTEAINNLYRNMSNYTPQFELTINQSDGTITKKLLKANQSDNQTLGIKN